MNREIKFRIWNKNAKSFIKDWDGNGKEINAEITLLNTLTNSITCLTDNYVIQQYTGLKDKNGKPVYEGDIVKYKLWEGSMDSKEDALILKREVSFNNGEFYPRYIKNECEDDWYSWEIFELVIIGNILENSAELLKN